MRSNWCRCCLFALWGGAYADSMDRRKLLVISEIFLALGSLVLAINAIASAAEHRPDFHREWRDVRSSTDFIALPSMRSRRVS